MLISFSFFNNSTSFNSYFVELITFPTTLFSPTNMHPELSLAVFPRCIKIPSKPGTLSKRGKRCFFVGDVFTITLYVPAGIAVSCITFIRRISDKGMFCSKPLSKSSNVSQKYFSSMYSLPIV